MNEELISSEFFESLTNIHLLGTHLRPSLPVPDMPDRLRNFEKILRLFGLQFSSHAEPEVPFAGFPGQQKPTPPPVPDITFEDEETITYEPTASPVREMRTAVVPVRVYLTGVPKGVNMTNDEQVRHYELQ